MQVPAQSCSVHPSHHMRTLRHALPQALRTARQRRPATSIHQHAAGLLKARSDPQNSLRCHSTVNSHGTAPGVLLGTAGVPWLETLERWPSSNGSKHEQLPTDLDAVVILAGGLKECGGQPPWVERRLDTAAGLRAAHVAVGKECPILCLGGGTPHKPPILCSNQYVIHESTSCALYLMDQRNVPASAILKEVSSYDTVGNAYFALTIHAIPAGWRNVGVVTSSFHMPRTKALFTHMFRTAGKDLHNDPDRYTLWFASSTDEGLWSEDVLSARIAKEHQSQVTWEKNASQIHSLRQLHEWLYATHQCYSVSRQHEANKITITDKKLLASY